MKKTRPCVLISPNEMNRHLQTLIIAPMTTASRNYPSRVEILHNDTAGWVVLDQLRTIDKSRIIKKIGALKQREITKTKLVLREIFQ